MAIVVWLAMVIILYFVLYHLVLGAVKGALDQSGLSQNVRALRRIAEQRWGTGSTAGEWEEEEQRAQPDAASDKETKDAPASEALRPCPSCGSLAEPHFVYCPDCGTKLPE